MSAVERPPRPRLVLRLGVTGHRPNRLDADEVGRVVEQCRQVIVTLRDIAAEARNPLLHAPGPPILRIVSPLAEGADRIAALAGLDLGCELDAPLPFAAGEYEHDFAEDHSRAEFRALLGRASSVLELDGSRDDEAAAYEAVGRTVIGQCDVLIAVWDGKGAAGRGGTPQIVAEAVARHLPVIWIDAHAATEPRLLLNDPAGRMAEKPLALLASWLVPRLAIPTRAENHHIAAAYFAERQLRFDTGQFFKIFRDLVAFGRWRPIVWRAAPYEDAARAVWEAEIAHVPELPEETRRYILERLCPHFAWADRLSDYYAGLYRSSYIANNLFSALAVLFALSGLIYEMLVARPVGVSGALIEVLLILAILTMTFLGRRHRWHARWLDYRQLAEQLRQLRYLGPLGCATPSPHLPAHVGAEPASWIDGLFRAILRDLGLAHGHLDGRYRAALIAWLNEVIADQITYHDGNAEMMTRLDHHLHRVGRALFWTTLLCCLTRVLIGGSDLLLIGAAIFPALGAAFYAIRNHGEFQRVADRSRVMSHELTLLRAELPAQDMAGAVSLNRLQQLATRAAEIMLAETIDWRVVFRYRPLVLPG